MSKDAYVNDWNYLYNPDNDWDDFDETMSLNIVESEDHPIFTDFTDEDKVDEQRKLARARRYWYNLTANPDNEYHKTERLGKGIYEPEKSDETESLYNGKEAPKINFKNSNNINWLLDNNISSTNFSPTELHYKKSNPNAKLLNGYKFPSDPFKLNYKSISPFIKNNFNDLLLEYKDAVKSKTLPSFDSSIAFHNRYTIAKNISKDPETKDSVDPFTNDVIYNLVDRLNSVDDGFEIKPTYTDSASVYKDIKDKYEMKGSNLLNPVDGYTVAYNPNPERFVHSGTGHRSGKYKILNEYEAVFTQKEHDEIVKSLTANLDPNAPAHEQEILLDKYNTLYSQGFRLMDEKGQVLDPMMPNGLLYGEPDKTSDPELHEIWSEYSQQKDATDVFSDFWEDPMKFLPFVHDVPEYSEIIKVTSLAQQLSQGAELNDEEMLYLSDYIRKTAWSSDQTQDADIAEGILNLIPYMLEFATVWGLSKSIVGIPAASSLATKKLLTDQAKKKLKSLFNKSAMKKINKWLAGVGQKKITKNVTFGKAVEEAGKGLLASSLFTDIVHVRTEDHKGETKWVNRADKNAARLMLPGLDIDQRTHDIVVQSSSIDETTAHKMGRFQGHLEFLSENLGAMFFKPMFKMFKTSNAHYIQKKTMLDAIMKKNPIEKWTKAGLSENAYYKALHNLFKGGGYDGIIEEYLEERSNQAGLAIAHSLGENGWLDPKWAEAGWEWKTPTSREFFTELAILAFPAGVTASIGTANEFYKDRRFMSTTVGKKIKAAQKLNDKELNSLLDQYEQQEYIPSEEGVETDEKAEKEEKTDIEKAEEEIRSKVQQQRTLQFTEQFIKQNPHYFDSMGLLDIINRAGSITVEDMLKNGVDGKPMTMDEIKEFWEGEGLPIDTEEADIFGSTQWQKFGDMMRVVVKLYSGANTSTVLEEMMGFSYKNLSREEKLLYRNYWLSVDTKLTEQEFFENQAMQFFLNENLHQYNGVTGQVKQIYHKYKNRFSKMLGLHEDNLDARLREMYTDAGLLRRTDIKDTKTPIDRGFVFNEKGKLVKSKDTPYSLDKFNKKLPKSREDFDIEKITNERSYQLGYQGSHRPGDDGPSADDLLSIDFAPKDVYESPQHYIGSTPDDYNEFDPDTPKGAVYNETLEFMQKIRNLRGNPNEEISIYRSSPVKQLNKGDWVTPSYSYAKQHGFHPTDDSLDMPVHEYKVKLKDIKWDGNSLEEWGYFGKDIIVETFDSEMNYDLKRGTDISFDLKKRKQAFVDKSYNVVKEKLGKRIETDKLYNFLRNQGIKQKEIDVLNIEDFIDWHKENEEKFINKNDLLNHLVLNNSKVVVREIGDDLSYLNLGYADFVGQGETPYQRVDEDYFKEVFDRLNQQGGVFGWQRVYLFRKEDFSDKLLDDSSVFPLEHIEEEIKTLKENAMVINPEDVFTIPIWVTNEDSETEINESLNRQLQKMSPKPRWANIKMKGDVLSYHEAIVQLPNLTEIESNKRYEDHWDSSFNTKSFGHVRYTIRTIDGKLVLFVEEMQSDYEQRVGANNNQLKKARDAQIRLGLTTSSREIPNTPFKNFSWVNLLLKVALRKGAEHGVDRIAFTNAKEQKKANNLFKTIENITYSPPTQQWTEEIYNPENYTIQARGDIVGEYAQENFVISGWSIIPKPILRDRFNIQTGHVDSKHFTEKIDESSTSTIRFENEPPEHEIFDMFLQDSLFDQLEENDSRYYIEADVNGNNRKMYVTDAKLNLTVGKNIADAMRKRQGDLNILFDNYLKSVVPMDAINEPDLHYSERNFKWAKTFGTPNLTPSITGKYNQENKQKFVLHPMIHRALGNNITSLDLFNKPLVRENDTLMQYLKIQKRHPASNIFSIIIKSELSETDFKNQVLNNNGDVVKTLTSQGVYNNPVEVGLFVRDMSDGTFLPIVEHRAGSLGKGISLIFADLKTKEGEDTLEVQSDRTLKAINNLLTDSAKEFQNSQDTPTDAPGWMKTYTLDKTHVGEQGAFYDLIYNVNTSKFINKNKLLKGTNRRFGRLKVGPEKATQYSMQDIYNFVDSGQMHISIPTPAMIIKKMIFDHFGLHRAENPSKIEDIFSKRELYDFNGSNRASDNKAWLFEYYQNHILEKNPKLKDQYPELDSLGIIEILAGNPISDKSSLLDLATAATSNEKDHGFDFNDFFIRNINIEYKHFSSPIEVDGVYEIGYFSPILTIRQNTLTRQIQDKLSSKYGMEPSPDIHGYMSYEIPLSIYTSTAIDSQAVFELESRLTGEWEGFAEIDKSEEGVLQRERLMLDLNKEATERLLTESQPSFQLVRKKDSILNNESMNIKDSTLWQWMLYHVQDDMIRLRKIEENIGDLPEDLQAYMKHELYIGKTKEKIIEQEEILNEFEERLLGDDIGISEFGEYLYFLHAKERDKFIKNKYKKDVEKLKDKVNNAKTQSAKTKHKNKLDQLIKRITNGSGKSTKEQKEYWEWFNSRPYRVNLYKKYAEEFQDKIIAKKLDMLYDNGLINEKKYKELKKQFKNFVPLKGFEETPDGFIETVKDISRRVTGKYNVPGAGIIGAKGRNSSALNPYVQAKADLLFSIQLAEKNEVLKALHDLILEHPDKNIWEVSGKRYIPKYDKEGEFSLMPSNDDLLPNQVALMVDGKVKIITLHDKMLRRAFKESKVPPTPLVHLLKNMASGFGSYFRAINTSLSPVFVVTNFLRDAQLAGIRIAPHLSKKHIKNIYKNVFSAIRGIYREERGKDPKNEWGKFYRDFKLDGGKVGWMDQTTVEEMMEDVKKKVKRLEENNNMKEAFYHIADFIESMNMAVEQGVRLATYRELIEAGNSREKSAQMAKNLTVNFNKRGASTGMFNKLFVFANANIQGTYNYLGSVIGPNSNSTSKKLFWGSVGFSFLLNFMNRMLTEGGEAEDDWDLVDDWRKDNRLTFSVPGTNKNYGLPIGYGINVPFALGSVLENHIASYGWYQNLFGLKEGSGITFGKGISRLFQATVSGFLPVSGPNVSQALMPTFLKPYVQWEQNADWLNRPIYRSPNVYGQDDPNHLKYFDRKTSKYSKDATNWLWEISDREIDLNPSLPDFIVGQYTGSAGRFVTDIINGGISAYEGVLPEPENLPFVKIFKGKNYGSDSYGIFRNMWYNAKKEKMSNQDIKRFYKHGEYSLRLGRVDQETYDKMIQEFREAQFDITNGTMPPRPGLDWVSPDDILNYQEKKARAYQRKIKKEQEKKKKIKKPKIKSYNWRDRL